MVRDRRVARTDEREEEFLVPSPPIPGPASVRYYDPLDGHRTLCIEFAQTPRTRDGILGFASSYGWLGEPVATSHNLVPGAEPLQFWKREIRAMARAVELWEQKKSKSLRDELLKLVNERLGTPRPILGGARDDDCCVEFFPSRVQPFLVPDGARFALRLVPRNLIGALWLQFAQIVSRTRKVSQCRACGKWFAPLKAERGKKRLYCSDACRWRAFRRRKKARRLETRRVKLRQTAARAR